jgi:hypothetical protein
VCGAAQKMIPLRRERSWIIFCIGLTPKDFKIKNEADVKK